MTWFFRENDYTTTTWLVVFIYIKCMNLYEKVWELIDSWMSHRKIAKELNIWVGSVSDIRNAKSKKHQIQKSFTTQKSDIEEDLSDLEKIIEKLAKKWVNVNVDTKPKSKWYIPKYIEPYTKGDINNVLVISDLHAPYILPWYLEHCREQQERWNCGTVVYIWDIVDFHSISYHEKIPEELNPAWEMAEARNQLQDWYYTFPNAKVLMWNHDLLIYRQARTAWLLREFIKDPNTIFQAPDTYEFVNELIIDDVLYTHWSTSDAWKKCILENMNMVSWHAHTKCWIMYHQNRHWQLWGMQVGVWIDYSKQAFEYAKSNSKYPVSACWVVLDNWKLPIVLPYDFNL